MATENEGPPSGFEELGPVQILTIAFDGNHFKGEILPELERLKTIGVIRIVDLLLVRKDSMGAVATLTATDLEWEEVANFGAMVGGLVGWGAGGAEGAEVGWMAGAAQSASGHHLDEEDQFALVQSIPNGSSCALILLEHTWAKPLRGAIRRANGIEIANSWLRMDELIRIGLTAARPVDEAPELE